MQPLSREAGFTLPELLIATLVMLTVLGTAATTFKTATSINLAATQTADANQNLRMGSNLLVRDLLQAARGIPTGGIPIPSGAGATAINRPGPTGSAYTFDNVGSIILPAIITGAGLGPTVDAQPTDMVTMLMADILLGQGSGYVNGLLNINNGVANQATLAPNGSYIDVGNSTAWLDGNPTQGIPAVQTGDLIWISNAAGSTIQTVTSTTATRMYFAAGTDWFNFNQPLAAQGSVTQILPPTTGTAQRILMVTYYIDNVTTPGSPQLVRVANAAAPQSMAGIVENLTFSYDLVDGVTNPTNMKTVPVTLGAVTYSANQIRKVNLEVGVRSDLFSALQDRDYIRSYVSTVVSIRSLAFVNRYQ